MAKEFKYIYGPVSSWRLGRSLGIDPISRKGKVCTFDCVYCQAGKASPYRGPRKVFVATREIMNEISALPDIGIDYITFSGAGEPTLAKNLGDIIKGIRRLRGEKIAVLTNSSLMHRAAVRRQLQSADFVIAKLDASSQALFSKINKPLSGLKIKRVIEGIKAFKREFRGKLALQIMLTDENKTSTRHIAALVKSIAPDEVQLNTPVRPCGEKPLSRKAIASVKRYFRGVKVLSVYDVARKKAKVLDRKSVLKRRGAV